MPVLKAVGGLFGVLAWVILLGLQRVWGNTFGWIFRTLADLLDRVSIPTKVFGDVRPFGDVSGWLRSLDRNVSATLAEGAHAVEHLAVWLFSRLWLMFSWLGREVEGLSIDLLRFAQRLVLVTIPRLVGRLLRAVWREIKAQARAARNLFASMVRKLYALGRALTKQMLRNLRDFLRFAKWATKNLGKVAKGLGSILKRLSGIDRKLGPLGFRKLFARALGQMGMLWLGTVNVKRVGEWLMQQDVGAVWEWVKDELAEIDFCKLAGYQYDFAVHVAEPVLQRLVAAQDWYCTLPGDTLPSAVASHPGYLGAWEPSATPPLDSRIVNRRLAPGEPLPRGVTKV